MNAVVVPAPPLRVVIVDDTADLRDLLRIALTRGGFEVVGEAGDGQGGIDVVRRHQPDVVLLDLAMPVMDGIEALPQIRRLTPHGKIVVLSGFGAQHMSERAVDAGADGYVQKGAPLTTILDYVRGVCDDDGGGGAATRPLSIVPRGLAPASPTPSAAPTASPASTASTASAGTSVSPSTTNGSDAEARTNASAWEALRAAPYGVIELADEPLFRIVYANPVAARLLGTDRAGTPLGMVAPDLAALVSFHRLDADASFEADVESGRVRATLRRTGWSILVYLDSAAEDLGLLRRAIATTAHEVRGPVAVLCGIAETLAWGGRSMQVPEQDRLLASVARQARILDQITADLLTAAQIQRGTLRVDLQVVEPRAVVAGVVESRFDVEVVVEDERRVRADPVRLEQMLTNLLSNATKYGTAPFVVRVRPSTEQPNGVCIDVVDHGDGVPADFREQLFREFARAHGAVATGTGLGLYVVRTLAQAQQGDVSYSPGTSGGSVFTITLRADVSGA